MRVYMMLRDTYEHTRVMFLWRRHYAMALRSTRGGPIRAGFADIFSMISARRHLAYAIRSPSNFFRRHGRMACQSIWAMAMLYARQRRWLTTFLALATISCARQRATSAAAAAAARSAMPLLAMLHALISHSNASRRGFGRDASAHFADTFFLRDRQMPADVDAQRDFASLPID